MYRTFEIAVENGERTRVLYGAGLATAVTKECRSFAGAVLTGISGEVAVGIVVADRSSSQYAAQAALSGF